MLYIINDEPRANLPEVCDDENNKSEEDFQDFEVEPIDDNINDNNENNIEGGPRANLPIPVDDDNEDDKSNDEFKDYKIEED